MYAPAVKIKHAWSMNVLPESNKHAWPMYVLPETNKHAWSMYALPETNILGQCMFLPERISMSGLFALIQKQKNPCLFNAGSSRNKPIRNDQCFNRGLSRHIFASTR